MEIFVNTLPDGRKELIDEQGNRQDLFDPNDEPRGC